MSEKLTYRSSGVDIDEAARALRGVADRIDASTNDAVIAGIGGFGALFRSPNGEAPLLVSSIDGIGTKTKVAAMVGDYSGLGADIVNHCVNDILCQGARPLFFLDYFGCSKISPAIFDLVVGGMADACCAVGCAMIGGETAEMPGVYLDEEIDIVGTIVGVVEEEMRLPRTELLPGDAVIGIAASGLHTNGFSLARKALFEVGGLSVRDTIPALGTTIGAELLKVHRSYFGAVYPLLQDPDLQENRAIRALAHLTGGGFHDNIPRVLGRDRRVMIERRSWTPLPIFELIQEIGGVSTDEMFRAFNMGIGMVMMVDPPSASALVQRLNEAGESAAVIGEVLEGHPEVVVV
ncbi:MAG: phosphoribosylformylglycinamidine cyclo-ligase [Armatimonadota bacterium]